MVAGERPAGQPRGRAVAAGPLVEPCSRAREPGTPPCYCARASQHGANFSREGGGQARVSMAKKLGLGSSRARTERSDVLRGQASAEIVHSDEPLHSCTL
eukprot:scaffold108341_cov51-Phaeocystis_antarctica.AAC.3